jgi:hypothetical protein
VGCGEKEGARIVSDFARWCVSVLIVSGAGILGLPCFALFAMPAESVDRALTVAWFAAWVVAVLGVVAILVGWVWGWL